MSLAAGLNLAKFFCKNRLDFFGFFVAEHPCKLCQGLYSLSLILDRQHDFTMLH